MPNYMENEVHNERTMTIGKKLQTHTAIECQTQKHFNITNTINSTNNMYTHTRTNLHLRWTTTKMLCASQSPQHQVFMNNRGNLGCMEKRNVWNMIGKHTINEQHNTIMHTRSLKHTKRSQAYRAVKVTNEWRSNARNIVETNKDLRN